MKLLFIVLLSVVLYNSVSGILKCYECTGEEECSKSLEDQKDTCGDKQRYCTSGLKPNIDDDGVTKFRECLYGSVDADLEEYCDWMVRRGGECYWCKEDYCNEKITSKQ
nr:PREDICTED: uncharacterized protein LOC107398846 [Tribolium castaneum]|eukprot:XP_015839859.1 PREDICTED: uncharacterized protein LOC107398846 [Tribolium castaneum]